MKIICCGTDQHCTLLKLQVTPKLIHCCSYDWLTFFVSGGALNSTHSLTHSLDWCNTKPAISCSHRN